MEGPTYKVNSAPSPEEETEAVSNQPGCVPRPRHVTQLSELTVQWLSGDLRASSVLLWQNSLLGYYLYAFFSLLHM